MPITKVSIPGMHCEGCAKLIKDVSNDYPQIIHVDVDLNAKTITLDHEPDFDLAKWSEEIESLDEKYKVQPSPPLRQGYEGQTRLRPAGHPLS